MLSFLQQQHEEYEKKTANKRPRVGAIELSDSSDEESTRGEPIPAQKKKKRKKKKKRAPTESMSLTSMYARADRSYEENKELLKSSKLLSRQGKIKAVTFESLENTKWARVLMDIRSFDEKDIQRFLRTVPVALDSDRKMRTAALQHSNTKEKREVLLRLAKDYLDKQRQRDTNTKAFQTKINTGLTERLYPDKTPAETQNVVKLVLNLQSATESEKQKEIQKCIYGDYAEKPSFIDQVIYDTDYFAFKVRDQFQAAGFEGEDQYFEAVELMKRCDSENKFRLMPLLDPLSHPKNMKAKHVQNKKNLLLKVPYPMLAGVDSKVKDIDKVFVADYGRIHNFMMTDLKKITDHGVPITQTQSLVPFSARIMKQFLENTIAEAKVKLELKIFLEDLTRGDNLDGKKIEDQIQNTLWKLRILDNFKYHLFLNFISAHLPKKLNFKEAWKHHQRALRFENKYPVSPNSDTLEKNTYNEYVNAVEPPFQYAQENIGQKIFDRLYEVGSDGHIQFKSYLFFQPKALKKNKA